MMVFPVMIGVSFYRAPASSFASLDAEALVRAWRQGDFAYSQTVLVATEAPDDEELILRTALERATAVDLGRSVPSHPPSMGDVILMAGALHVIRRFGFERIRTRASARTERRQAMNAWTAPEGV